MYTVYIYIYVYMYVHTCIPHLLIWLQCTFLFGLFKFGEQRLEPQWEKGAGRTSHRTQDVFVEGLNMLQSNLRLNQHG